MQVKSMLASSVSKFEFLKNNSIDPRLADPPIRVLGLERNGKRSKL